MTMIRRVLFPRAATVLLLGLCLMPKSLVPKDETETARRIPHLDKAIHFTMFAGVALAWALAGPSPRPSRSRAAAVLGLGFALAVGTELAQGLPQVDRDPDTLDALADAVGAVAGVGAVAAWGASTTRVDTRGSDEGG